MKTKRWLLTDQHLQDINPLVAGEERCKPGHRFGPHVRDYTLMHYVLSGKGTFWARGKAYTVLPGQVFLILPGEVTTYEADRDDPWHYRWVGFNGTLSRRFSRQPAVFDLPRQLYMDIFPEEDSTAPEYTIAGGLLRLYGFLFPAETGVGDHVRKVQDLIRAAYMQPLRVQTIARELNLDRRYLTRLFKAQTGSSIQGFLVRTRLEAADRALAQGFSVQETARLCGYEDASNFSRIYKKHRGTSPRQRKP